MFDRKILKIYILTLICILIVMVLSLSLGQFSNCVYTQTQMQFNFMFLRTWIIYFISHFLILQINMIQHIPCFKYKLIKFVSIVTKSVLAIIILYTIFYEFYYSIIPHTISKKYELQWTIDDEQNIYCLSQFNYFINRIITIFVILWLVYLTNLIISVIGYLIML